MDLFKGKSPSERNKLIAAIALGFLAVAALAFAFGPGFFSRGTTATTTASPSPSPSGSPKSSTSQTGMPSQADQNFVYLTTPVVYSGSAFGAPDPGRNIFAFYEPPPPTPYSPTPIPPTPLPTPEPTPKILVGFIMPQSAYAGARGFRLEVNGDRFTPEAKIYFNQGLLPTNFISAQKLTADVPANFIASEGPKQIIVQSLDGKEYSNPVMLSVMAPPKPNVHYIGMYSGQYSNNHVAYFIEQSKLNTPGAMPERKRLNDVVSGRFRVISIGPKQVVVEDTSLGFRHSIPLYQAPGGPGGPGGSPSFPNTGRPVTVPGFPNVTFPPNTNTNRPPRPQRPQDKKEDEDDDDGDGN